MTIQEALEMVRQAGSLRLENGRLLVRFPETARAQLQPALDVLRSHREEAVRLLAVSPVEAANSTESQASPDCQAEPAPEPLEILLEFADSIEEFGKHFEIPSVRVATDRDRGVPYAAWKARELNRIFAQHGTGGAGRITASTVAHGLEKETERLTKKGENQNGPTQ